MRKLYLFFVPVIAMFSAVTGNAQGRYGKDSVECVMNLSFYNDYLRQNNLEEAVSGWRKAMQYCPPGSRQDIYQHGQRIYKYLMDNEQDAAAKARLVDSLLMMYDLRTQYFPNNALSAKTFKVYDMADLRPGEHEAIMNEAKATVELGGAKTDPAILGILMQKAGLLFSENKMNAEEFMALYSDLSEVISEEVAGNVENASIVKADMDNIFATSGVASCENIVELFTPKFNENPNDLNLVKMLVKLLSDGDCIQEELFLNSVEALNKIEPSYMSTYYLYRLYSAKDDHENALNMLQGAIDSEESNSEEDAKLLIDMATYYLQKLENPVKAAEYARLAMAKDNAQAGRGNFVLGSVWGFVKCSGNEIESRANYWVAVDYFNKARNADPSLTEEVNRLVNMYSRYFPAQEEAFMYDFVDGQSFTVSCGGLRETTVIRTRK